MLCSVGVVGGQGVLSGKKNGKTVIVMAKMWLRWQKSEGDENFVIVMAKMWLRWQGCEGDEKFVIVMAKL